MGKSISAGGDVYEGDWQDGRPQGQGTLQRGAGGLCYTGLFEDGIPAEEPAILAASFPVENPKHSGSPLWVSFASLPVCQLQCVQSTSLGWPMLTQHWSATPKPPNHFNLKVSQWKIYKLTMK